MSRRGTRFALLIALLVVGCVEARTYKPLIPPAPSVPRARLPQNNAYIGSIHSPDPRALRPRFAWTPAVTEEREPIKYELEISASKDFSNVLRFETEDIEYRPMQALDVSLEPPVGRRYYWRVRACLPLICSAHSAIRWINLGRSAHDYNGDGFADTLVGAPEDNQNGQYAGRAYVYFGGRGTTFDTTPDGILANSAPDDELGKSIASAGDYNGDGFADVLVGTSRMIGEGIAHLYLGGPGPSFEPTPDGTFTARLNQDRFGSSVSSAGDMNGDGFDDLLVGAPGDPVSGVEGGNAYVFFGGATVRTEIDFTLSLSGNHNFGDRVSSLGDINGDGFSDVVVNDSQPVFTPEGDCHSLVFFGRPKLATFPDATLKEQLSNCKLLTLPAGDVDGDGLSDLLWARGSADTLWINNGFTHLQLGRSDFPSTLTMELPLRQGAFAMSRLGDMNGDGFDDIATVELTGSMSTVFLALGHRSPALPILQTSQFSGLVNDSFARAMSSPGDLNGDGFDDLLIAAPQRNSMRGAVNVYFGGRTIDASPVAVLDAGISSAFFGYAVGR